MLIPLGPWRPDIASLNEKASFDVHNVMPAAKGFTPFPSPVGVTNALPSDCLGAVTLRNSENSSVSVAGTATDLYRLEASQAWIAATRTTAPYETASGDRWQFATFGDLLIAVNGTGETQKLDMLAPDKFTALGGDPPSGRYIAQINAFLVLGDCYKNGQRAANRIQWCEIGNAEGWRIGSQLGDYQDFYSGGPVTGVMGGEVGFIFQRANIHRMIFTPGSDAVFQIDHITSERGCIAPYSLVKVGSMGFFLSGDGFYMIEAGSGQTKSIDELKMRQWFRGDVKAGQEFFIIGSVDPIRRVVRWSYCSKRAVAFELDAVLIYDWVLDDWSRADLPVQSYVDVLGNAYTLDTMDPFGPLDTLPYSLDSPYWTGNTPVSGVITPDRRVSTLTGPPLAALIETNENKIEGGVNTYISATAPEIDTDQATVALAGRARPSDVAVWEDPSGVEDTGFAHQHLAARYVRARIEIPAAAPWTLAQALDVIQGANGKR
jgi:hypothetical protein